MRGVPKRDMRQGGGSGAMTVAHQHNPDVPWQNAMMLLIVLMLIGAGLAWLHFGLGVWQTALEAQRPSGGDAPVILDVGGYNLAIPENTIRFPPASLRRDMTQFGRVDVVAHWPTMRGYSDALAEIFKDTSETAPFIHVSLIAESDPVTEEERYTRIYRPAFGLDRPQGPAGLSGYRLATRSGYGGEILYQAESPGPVPAFFIRCNERGSNDAPATCFRRIRLQEGLLLEYRYRIGMLPHWRQIETAVRAFVAKAAR